MTNPAALAMLDRILFAFRVGGATEQDWTNLYDLLWPYVLSVTFRELGGVRADAEEAAQDVFVRLVRYKPFDRVENAEEFLAYVAGMARNAARDLRGRRAPPAPTLEVDEIPGGRSPEQVLIDRDALEKLLRQVPGPDRLLLELISRGASYREAAETLGTTEEAVTVRIHRLRRRLGRGDRDPGGDRSP